MAKKTETAVVAPVEDLQAMYEEMGLSPDQVAELLGLTGQNTAFNMDRTPVLKVNKFGIEDVNVKTIPMGNFVLNQVAKEDKAGDVTIEDIGEDFGKNPEITVLKFGTQFTYFPKSKDKKQICSSQIVLEMGEKAHGNNLGYECADKTCPKRSEAAAEAKDKCVCSYVVFVEVTNAEGEKKKALMYFKGTSFMPFMEYVKSAGKYPLFFAPTVLETERKTKGTNTYWIVTPVLQKDRPYAAEARMINFETAKIVNENVRAFEEQKKLQSTTTPSTQKQLPSSSSTDISQVPNGDDIEF